jgi:hypothetical protein
MFLLDLLGRKTVAAKIFKNKFEEDFSETQAVSQFYKAFAVLFLVACNAFFIYYSLLKSLQKGRTWQYQYLQGCIAQMVVEIFLNETLECIWLNYCVPDLARKEVKRVTALLHKVVDQITAQVDEVKNSLLFLDAPSYLFSSTKVAKTHPGLLESVVVLNFHSHLPGELSRTWPHYKRVLLLQSEKDEMLVDNDAGPVGNSGIRATRTFIFRAILAVGAWTVLTMQWMGSLSFNMQRIIIRFVQPLLLSGLTLLWLFASSGTVALFTVAGCTFGFIWAFLWRQRYLYHKEQRLSQVVPEEETDCLDTEEPTEAQTQESLHQPTNQPFAALVTNAGKAAQSDASSRSDGSGSSHSRTRAPKAPATTMRLSERFRNLRSIISSSSEDDSESGSETSSSSSIGISVVPPRSTVSVDTPSTISLTNFTNPKIVSKPTAPPKVFAPSSESASSDDLVPPAAAHVQAPAKTPAPPAKAVKAPAKAQVPVQAPPAKTIGAPQPSVAAKSVVPVPTKAPVASVSVAKGPTQAAAPATVAKAAQAHVAGDESSQPPSKRSTFDFDIADLYDDMDEEEEEALNGHLHALGLTKDVLLRTGHTPAAGPSTGVPVSPMTALSSAKPTVQYRAEEVNDSMFADIYEDSDEDIDLSDFSDEFEMQPGTAVRAAAPTTPTVATGAAAKPAAPQAATQKPPVPNNAKHHII